MNTLKLLLSILLLSTYSVAQLLGTGQQFEDAGTWFGSQTSYTECAWTITPSQTSVADGATARIGTTVKVISFHLTQLGNPSYQWLDCADANSYYAIMTFGIQRVWNQIPPSVTNTLWALQYPSADSSALMGTFYYVNGGFNYWTRDLVIPNDPSLVNSVVFAQATHIYSVNQVTKSLWDRGLLIQIQP